MEKVSGTIFGFNLELPESSLKTAVVFSLLSVWVLVGLFQYLNRYTRRRYFAIWTGGWLFYALFLTIRASLEHFASPPLLMMLENWCIAIAAVLMFWGSFSFLELRVGQRLIAIAILFVSIWSYSVAYEFPGELWIKIPAFALLGGASLFTAVGFFLQRKRTPYVGIGLLTFGFGLWALYLVFYPFLQASEVLLSTGFLISTVLQLFIATSMIILVLEEVKTTLKEREQQILTEKGKAQYFEATAMMHQDRYQKLFENASDAIVILEPNTLQVLEINEAARRLLHLEKQKPAALNLPLILRSPGQKGDVEGVTWLERLCEAMEGTLTVGDELPRQVQVRGGPITYGGREAFELFLSELTERERLQQQLRQSEKMAALGQMVSGLAHELNNPLAAIKGFAELLMRDKKLDAYARESLTKMARESARATTLVQNFLAFAQQDSARKETVHLNVLVASVAEARRAELEMAGCELRLHLSAEDPTLSGNSDQLREVLNHLITNARQAMEKQAREKVLALSTWQRDGKVGVRVDDTGPGVPQNIVPRIFEPFFTTKEQGAGTGLGLSVAHNIVATHRGRIWYEKRPLGGASFLIELPQSEQKQSSNGAPAGGAPAKILIVDDEEALGSLLREMLGLIGHDVSVTQSPRDALRQLKEQNFDLVISDFRMPEMNGAEFYAEALKIQESYRKRFIFLTGDVVYEAAREFFTKEPVPRLLKPFQFQDIEKMIQTMLSDGNGSGALAA